MHCGTYQILGAQARSFRDLGLLCARSIMMDIEEDVDLDAMADMEDEYMREAELERLQQEAEIAMESRFDGGQLKPYFEDLSSGAALLSRPPQCSGGEPVLCCSGQEARISATSQCSSGIDLVAVEGGLQTQRSDSVGPTCSSMSPPKPDHMRCGGAPCTPPPRIRAAAPVTPPKEAIREGGAADAAASVHSQMSVVLPVSAEPASCAAASSSDRQDNEPAALSSAVKRRRIVGKGGNVASVPEPIATASQAPTVTMPEGLFDFPKYVESIEWPAASFWEDMKPAQQYWYVRDKVLATWIRMSADKQVEAPAQDSEVKHSGGWRNRWKDRRAQFNQLSSEHTKMLMRCLLEVSTAPAYVVGSLARHVQDSEQCLKKMQSALWTWVSREWQLPPAASKNRDVATAVAVARKVGWVERKFRRFVEFVKEQANRLEGVDWAAACEICKTTLKEEGVAVVHLHMYLRHRTHKVRYPLPAELVFEQVRPHCSATPQLGTHRVKPTLAWGGYFYCCIEKIGQVHTESNKEPFRDFPVQGNWIMSLLQAEKICVSTAKCLAFRVAHGVTRLLADLRVVEEQIEKQVIEAAQQRAARCLATSKVPFRQVAEVSAWVTDFDVVKSRYQFLVLEGPSGVGKTEFARSLCRKGRTVYEVNCAAGGEPDLRGFRFQEHGLILLDEIEADAVAAQRKLFQASTAAVQLGTSPTNIHVYTVYVHGVMIVCCSNNWTASLERLSADDANWIRKNSVYYHVTEPLFDTTSVEPSATKLVWL